MKNKPKYKVKISQHRLRSYVDSRSPLITDKELDEVETLIPFDSYNDSCVYDFSGNFIFTKSKQDRDNAILEMCCGIVSKDIELSNKETIYFAFDYGH